MNPSQGTPASLDRFRVVSPLGKGGAGVVYRAYDPERGVDVALKTLARVSVEGGLRLKREFRALADISHPNLVALHELFFADGQWFFTMELVLGQHFMAWTRRRDIDLHMLSSGGVSSSSSFDNNATQSLDLEQTAAPLEAVLGGDTFSWTVTGDATAEVLPNGAILSPHGLPARPARGVLDEARLRDALRQLCHGVIALHRTGRSHGDLKPANVLVDHDGRVVILDFGLVSGAREIYEGPARGRTEGTPAYMSPERYGGSPVAPPSDWFAVGVMLYQALAGQLPFFNASAFATSDHTPPTPPAELDCNAPADLSALALDLLAWNPDDRPDDSAILAWLGVEDQSGGPAPEIFLGRAAELAALREAFHASREGRTVIIRIEGRSGVGKSALVRAFLGGLVERDEAVVLAGRCYERERVAYKVFDGVIETLARYLGQLSYDELDGLLPDDLQALGRLFPVLQRLPASLLERRPLLSLPDPREIATRGGAALRSLLVRLAAHGPLVVSVDDLQWGDVDSARLLGDLLRGPEPLPMLFISTCRSEDLGENAVLATLIDAIGGEGLDVRTLSLGPLSADDARALATALLDDEASADRAAHIAAESDGSPFFVEELAWTHRGRVTEAGLGLREVLSGRVQALPEDARAVLEVIAVAGHPIPQGLALDCAGLDRAAAGALAVLRAGHFVRTSGAHLEDLVESYHDRVRETVADELGRERLSTCHRRIAESLEGRTPLDVEALTEHWAAAGEPIRAGGYAITAALQAARALAFDRAGQLYRRALDLLPDDDARRPHLLADLADALRNAGRGPEAADAYLAAAASAGPELSLNLTRGAMEQLLISGHVDKGLDVAARVLAAVGLRLPGSPLGIIVGLLISRARLFLRGRRFTPRREDQIPADLRARAEACWSMATGLAIVDSKMGADFTTRFLVEALATGEGRWIARGLAFEAAHQSTSGSNKAAEKLLAEAEALGGPLQDPHTAGFLLLMRGFIRYFQGEFRQALTAFDAALLIFRQRCVGVSWELTTAIMFGNWSLIYLGEWAELDRRGGRLLVAARRRGNLYLAHGLQVSYGIVGTLMRDDVEAARGNLKQAMAGWSTRGFQIQHFLYLYMGSWIDLYAGTAAEAHKRVLDSWPALSRSMLLQVNDVAMRMFHIRGYTALAAGGDLDVADVKRCAAKVARIPARGSGGVSEIMLAALAAKRGDKDGAARHLESAASIFDQAEIPLFAAGARWRLGALRGGEAGSALVHTAAAAMAAQGIASPERALNIFAPGFQG